MTFLPHYKKINDFSNWPQTRRFHSVSEGRLQGGTSFSWGYKKASVLGSSWLDTSAVQRILRIICKTDAVACMWSPLYKDYLSIYHRVTHCKSLLHSSRSDLNEVNDQSWPAATGICSPWINTAWRWSRLSIFFKERSVLFIPFGLTLLWVGKQEEVAGFWRRRESTDLRTVVPMGWQSCLIDALSLTLFVCLSFVHPGPEPL